MGRLDPESVAESVTLAAQSTITVTRRVAIAMFDPDANAFRSWCGAAVRRSGDWAKVVSLG